MSSVNAPFIVTDLPTSIGGFAPGSAGSSAPTLKAHESRTVPVAGSASSQDTYWVAAAMGTDFLLLGGVNDPTEQSCKYAIVSGADLSVIGSGDLDIASGIFGYVDWPPIANGEGGNSNYVTNMVTLDDTNVVVAVVITSGDHYEAHLLTVTRSGSTVSITNDETVVNPLFPATNGVHFRIAKTSANGFTVVWMADGTNIQAATYTFSGATTTQTHMGTQWPITSDDLGAEIPHFIDQFTGLPDGSSVLLSTYTYYKITSSAALDSSHVLDTVGVSDLVGTGSGRFLARLKHNWRRAYTDVSTFDQYDDLTGDLDSVSSNQRISSWWDGTQVFEANYDSASLHVRETSVGSTGAPSPGPQTDTSSLNNTQVTSIAAVSGTVLVVTRASGSDLEMYLYGVSGGGGAGMTSHVSDLDVLPAGFGGGYASGVMMAFTALGASSTVQHVAVHRPGHINGYGMGWHIVPGFESVGEAVISSQRHGVASYVFSDAAITRFTGPTSATTVHSGSTSGLSIVPGSNPQFFVSDDETPFLWHAYTSGSTYYATGAPENGTALGDATSGLLGAYRQAYTVPAGAFIAAYPTLVFPWKSGNYGFPELWWPILEFDTQGRTTGRVKIYRAAWKAAAFQRQGSLSDDSSYNSGPSGGGTLYPHLNPTGHAFEHAWFDSKHLVGVFGPFAAPLYNPAGTLAASSQNTSASMTLNHFRVQRDLSKFNVLHLSAGDSGSHPTVANSINGMWLASSPSDGANWTRPRQMPVPAAGSTKGGNRQVQVYAPLVAGAVVTPIARTNENFTLMGIGYNVVYLGTHDPGAYADEGQRITMASLDVEPSGAASAAAFPPVFRRGVTPGLAWL